MSPRITTPFGWGSTAAEVIDGVDLSGRRAIVTGAASGIGVETARALAGAGAEVTLAVRNVAAGEATAADIIATTQNKAIFVAPLDLADRASVAAFTAAWTGPLHILVNNAGVMAPPLTRTPEGWELQFTTNHLGHFGLTTGLRPALAAAAGARVVSLTSVGHVNSPVVFDDIQFDYRPYDPGIAYGQSKTANSLFAVEAAQRWADDGILVNAVHPGAIAATNLARFYDAAKLEELRTSGVYEYKTIEQGASTSVLAAASPLLAGVTGRYFEDCNQAEPYVAGGPRKGVAPWALDPDDAARLWSVSLDLLAS